ncbi:MAG TPA: hypothetical protein VMT93_08860 [Gemmatimonadaceae bacterium]|nr:hypothetical protein [Gemmatimonadaceae bacterium]
MRLVALFALLIPATLTAQSPDASLAPLDSVVAQVERALLRYQATLGAGPDALPPLKSATFDFKTTAARSTGVTVNLLVFTIGASKQTDVVNDVSFTYAVPRATDADRRKFAAAPSVEDQLYETIRGAAAAVRSGAGAVGGMPLTQFTVALQYGVQWDQSAGAHPRLQLVTVGLKSDQGDNSVQTLRLVFSR